MTTLANGFMALVGGFAIVAQTCPSPASSDLPETDMINRTG
jgi:hypothetical protein